MSADHLLTSLAVGSLGDILMGAEASQQSLRSESSLGSVLSRMDSRRQLAISADAEVRTDLSERVVGCVNLRASPRPSPGPSPTLILTVTVPQPLTIISLIQNPALCLALALALKPIPI